MVREERDQDQNKPMEEWKQDQDILDKAQEHNTLNIMVFFIN